MKLTLNAENDLWFIMTCGALLLIISAMIINLIDDSFILYRIHEYSEILYFILEGMIIISVILASVFLCYIIIDLLRELNDAINHCDECNSFALKLYSIRTGELDAFGNEGTKEYCKKCLKKLKIKTSTKTATEDNHHE